MGDTGVALIVIKSLENNISHHARPTTAVIYNCGEVRDVWTATGCMQHTATADCVQAFYSRPLCNLLVLTQYDLRIRNLNRHFPVVQTCLDFIVYRRIGQEHPLVVQ